jgi:hypothetical protein
VTEILEREASRRVAEGTLSDAEVEKVGVAFMQIREKTKSVAREFGLDGDNDLHIGLGPLVMSRPQATAAAAAEGGSIAAATAAPPPASLVDLIDKVIDEGAVIAGDIKIAVAGVDLVALNLLASISSVNRPKRERRRQA